MYGDALPDAAGRSWRERWLTGYATPSFAGEVPVRWLARREHPPALPEGLCLVSNFHHGAWIDVRVAKRDAPVLLQSWVSRMPTKVRVENGVW